MHRYNFLYIKVFIVFCFVASWVTPILAQDSIATPILVEDSVVKPILAQDSIATPVPVVQSLPADSQKVAAPKDTTKKASEQFDAEINYSATDSIVFFGNGTGYMYGNTKLQYKDMNLTEASMVRVRMDSTTIHAYSTRDSTGTLVGKPIFKDKDSEYTSIEMTYNFNTKRGFVRQAVTQQGEGYIISDRTKIIDNSTLNLADGKYTTCDHHDHPHFHLQLSKAKVKPGEYVVTGPAHLVILDVPLPLAVPFGFFPFNDTYSSGFEMPAFDTEFTRGFGLTNGGYYFAISDYADLSVKGDVYMKGTWALNLASNYLKRYKFNGGVSISYREDVMGEKDLPNYSKAKNLSIRWSHTQNPKVNPFRTFSASVNFSTSGYNRSNINSYYSPVSGESTKSSSVSFSQRFPNSPFSITANLGIDQRTRDSTVNLTLPNVSISMSRIYPLKRKNKVGKDRWYEKISMSYTGNLSNSLTAKENMVLKSSLADDWRNGMQHNIPISASFNLFDFITISPSFSYRERWYLGAIDREWDKETGRPVDTKLHGFKRAYDFNMNVSANTTIYGIYAPLWNLFGGKVLAIRHKFDPSVGFGYTPDFGDPKWGFWDSYMREFADPKDPKRMLSEEVFYSRFEKSMYGGPGRGKTGNVFFSMANNLEMKVKNDADSTGLKPTKIVSLIEHFALSSAYNFAADSMRWSNINAELRIKVTDSYTFRVRGTFDPYMWGVGPDGTSVRKVNKLRWNHGKFPRFMGTSVEYDYTLSNETFKRKEKRSKKGSNENSQGDGSAFGDDPNNPNQGHSLDVTNKGTNKNIERGAQDEDGYEEFSMPWSITFNYSVRFGDGNIFNYEKMEYNRKLTHGLQVSGNIQLTPGWRISAMTNYDFEAKQFALTTFNVTRNLHCWTLTGNFVPFGRFRSYNFRIGVNSSMLQDLKFEKQSGTSAAQNRVAWY